jgi:uncharacterized phage protein gp47/JayE
MAGLTNTGFIVKTLEEINSSVDEKNKSILGSGTESRGEGAYITFRDSITLEISEMWQALLAITKQRGIQESEGVQLSSEASIVGITKAGKTQSIINNVEVFGSEGSIIPEFYQMQVLSTGQLFQTTQEYVVPAVGLQPLIITLTALESGPVPCIAGDLTGTYPIGITSIQSIEDAIVGRNEETDEEFKADYPNKIAQIGGGSLSAIVEGVRSVPGVVSATGRENRTGIVDAFDLSPFSFEIIVRGGTDQDIAEKIFEKSSAGGPITGNTTVVLVYEGNNIPIKFSRPTPINIYIDVIISSYNTNFPSGGGTIIENNILSYGDTLNAGDDVLLPSLQNAITNVPGILSYSLKFDVITPPVNEISNIIIDVNETAIIDSINLNVTVL